MHYYVETGWLLNFSTQICFPIPLYDWLFCMSEHLWKNRVRNLSSPQTFNDPTIRYAFALRVNLKRGGKSRIYENNNLTVCKYEYIFTALTEYDMQLNKAPLGSHNGSIWVTKDGLRSRLFITLAPQSGSLPFMICGRGLLPLTDLDFAIWNQKTNKHVWKLRGTPLKVSATHCCIHCKVSGEQKKKKKGF